MKPDNILYERFLTDKSIYKENVQLWKNILGIIFDDVISNKNRPILNRNLNNEDFYDGNPIFSYYNSTYNKAIRIIQEDPKELEKYDDIKLLEAWTDTLPWDNKEIPELVISLYLTLPVFLQSLKLIQDWMLSERNDLNLNLYSDAQY